MLGQLALCNRPDIDSYKLELLCGYLGIDLDCRFNTRSLKTIEQIEAACNGIHDLFRDLIMRQLLGESKQIDRPSPIH